MATIKSNMSGTILKINVEVGSKIAPGQEIIIVESMKMEMPIVSDASGTIKEIKVAVDDFVEEGQDILEVDQ